jgi:hypothetical protein
MRGGLEKGEGDWGPNIFWEKNRTIREIFGFVLALLSLGSSQWGTSLSNPDYFQG